MQGLKDDRQILYDQAEMEAYMKQASLDALSDSFVNLENQQQTICAAFVPEVQDGRYKVSSRHSRSGEGQTNDTHPKEAST